MMIRSSFLLLLLLTLAIPSTGLASRKSYLVFLDREYSENHGLDSEEMSAAYHGLLSSSLLISQEKAEEAILYSYSSQINGFAAFLEDEEAKKLSGHPGVVSVRPTRKNRLLTTRSWDFMGLEDSTGGIPDDSIWRASNFGEGVIIANLDSGVWPESPSFNCTVPGAIPSRWKGKCDTSGGFKCNGKLIGARYFTKAASAEHNLKASENSAMDVAGHGTLTLSTAAGCFVPGANLLGSANGTAKGGCPKAWVVAYKVDAHDDGADDADILAGFEAAIQDGVDIISISLGTHFDNYSSDVIAIGSFHAVKKGIPVVAAAGNDGGSSTVLNVAPWIFTVAASTVDRRFESNVVLGNGQKFKGIGLNTNTSPVRKFYPLIDAVNAKFSDAYPDKARLCNNGTLEPSKVKGKVVLCESDASSNIDITLMISQMGGVGVVFSNPFPDPVFPRPHYLPTSVVSKRDGDSIESYLAGTKSPVAYISGGTVIGDMVEAPIMASFSSVGPNPVTPGILKPDVTAPGVGILAAYAEAVGPSGEASDDRRVPFNIDSGTSLSCPHVAGIAGLVKKVHPDWSPAAIKSAIMTTASTNSNKGETIRTFTGFRASPFNYGAGHISPNNAHDPGLVYDMNITDYLDFLCYIGYDDKRLAMFYDKPHRCPPTQTATTSLSNLNYPSVTISRLPAARGRGRALVTVSRTLKNVGTPGVYTATVDEPAGVSVKVQPGSLVFSEINEEKSFKLTVQDMGSGESGYVFGQLTWSDGLHYVKSPIVVNKGKRKV